VDIYPAGRVRENYYPYPIRPVDIPAVVDYFGGGIGSIFCVGGWNRFLLSLMSSIFLCRKSCDHGKKQ